MSRHWCWCSRLGPLVMGDFVGEYEGQAEGWDVGLLEGALVGVPLVGASVG